MNEINVALGNLSDDELEQVVELVKAEKKRRREVAKENAEAVKEQRAEFANENVSDGDSVRFMFGKRERVGTVKRVNKKTFTIEFELDGETVERYRKPEQILGYAEETEPVAEAM